MPIHWQQIASELNVPQIGLASRTSGPATSPGGAAASLASSVSSALRDHAVAHRIKKRKLELTPILEEVFQNHATGGVLVVATIEVIPMGSGTAHSFRYMHLNPGIYAHPTHAIQRWRRQPTLSTPRNFSHFSFILFWVTRAAR